MVKVQALVISEQAVRDVMQKMNANAEFEYPFKCGFLYKYFPNLVTDLKQSTLE